MNEKKVKVHEGWCLPKGTLFQNGFVLTGKKSPGVIYVSDSTRCWYAGMKLGNAQMLYMVYVPSLKTRYFQLISRKVCATLAIKTGESLHRRFSAWCVAYQIDGNLRDRALVIMDAVKSVGSAKHAEYAREHARLLREDKLRQKNKTK